MDTWKLLGPKLTQFWEYFNFHLNFDEFQKPQFRVGYTKRALKLPETVAGEVDTSQFGGGRLGETEICSVSLKQSGL